jgi:uncharacterized protein YdeI (YjbR/CyaY-like superfamily)
MPADLPILTFPSQSAFESWLDKNHATSPGIWLKFFKKTSGQATVVYAEALDVALCYGWIDGQKRGYDADSWLQKFTRRGPRSIWSKINRARVEVLIRDERMQPPGLAAVEAARGDGRWEAAYEGSATAEVPADLQTALDASPPAAARFAALNRTERYAILFRLQTATTAVTRAKRIQQAVATLENAAIP